MDILKAEVRGDRGARRKSLIRLTKNAKQAWFMPESASDRSIGKFVSSRKSCNHVNCKSPDHSTSIAEMKSNEDMAHQLKSVGLAA